MPRTVANEGGTPPVLPEVGFVRLPQILAVLPVGKTTWWEGVRAGRFPAPAKLGSRISAWRVEDIRALLARLAEPTTV